MRSIRTKITLLTVCAIVAAMTLATVLAAVSIQNYGSKTSDQILSLLCETGEKNLNAQFDRVEQSVETVFGYAEEDLAKTDLSHLGDHLERVKDVFEKTANSTDGILTYYYRIDPEISTTHKGFWFVDLDGEGFREHEVTDITLYDTADQSALVWFTVPKATGSPVWLQPYFTDNLDEYVLSYNVPVYKFGRFIGVIGIEIDYDTIVEPVSAITLYDNGYAFINNDEGDIIYHPRMALEDLTGENKPKVPDGLLSENSNVRYTFEGVEKQAVWMPLNNGMRLNVTVPISEINQRWHTLIREIVGVSVVLLILFVFLTMRLSGRITKPLRELTEVAEQVDAGNYDVDLRYNGDDEVGILTRTFSTVIGHLKTYISDLNSLAYADALTSVRNKGAFDLHVREMDARIKDPDDSPEFAVGFFDCDDLKSINDEFGHDKGDIYLQIASDLICRVFRHSPVFRTGGDEFAVILQGEDYRNRSDLALFFNEVCMGNADTHNAKWEKVGVSLGIAAYDPKTDYNFNDVARRADKLMYENKRARKATRGGVPEQA